MIRTTALFLSLLSTAPALRSQVDGLDTIKKILVRVASEMEEIDRLLRESSSRDAAARMAENVTRIELRTAASVTETSVAPSSGSTSTIVGGVLSMRIGTVWVDTKPLESTARAMSMKGPSGAVVESKIVANGAAASTMSSSPESGWPSRSKSA